MKITRKMFIEAVGQEPTHDDLERCNCKRAGQIGHTYCGWDQELQLPEFIAVGERALRRRLGPQT